MTAICGETGAHHTGRLTMVNRRPGMDDLARLQPAGWRARIGVVTPHSNTVNEAEFHRLAPDGVSFPFARVPLHPDPAADGFATLLDDLAGAMTALAACRVDAAAYACTADSMACPEDRLIACMRHIAGVAAVTTAGAILDALALLGARRIALASPYRAATNADEAAFLARHGVTVVAAAGMDLDGTAALIQEISLVPPARVFELARIVDRPEAEAVLICCTDLNTIDVIAPLEAALGKPVVSSNTATLRAVLGAAGIDTVKPGFGQLLDNFKQVPQTFKNKSKI
jgi:maleate isomerase